MRMLNRDATAEHTAYMSSEEVVSTGVQVEVEDVEVGVQSRYPSQTSFALAYPSGFAKE